MKSLKEDYFNAFFSHIYVEESVRKLPRTQEILSKFPAAKVIEIGHYKDIFCRSKQSFTFQHRFQNLILAAKQGTLIYEGAPVCQSFGNDHFYYTSCMMNCIFDCEYCYLKGMYPSANIVIFVNLEDFFAQVEEMLKSHPMYLCVSYDTDLLALERIIGYAEKWCAFTEKHENLKIEIRTKCANKLYARNARPVPGVIYAFTLSPQAVIDACEHQTPALKERLSCAAEMVKRGIPVRLCFDPMIYLPGWKQYYEEMLRQVYDTIDLEKIVDVSVGSFRISQDYLKKMRRQEPDSAVVWFPFQNEDGFYHYPKELMEQMESFLTGRLEEKISKEKIFRWKE